MGNLYHLIIYSSKYAYTVIMNKANSTPILLEVSESLHFHSST